LRVLQTVLVSTPFGYLPLYSTE